MLWKYIFNHCFILLYLKVFLKKLYLYRLTYTDHISNWVSADNLEQIETSRTIYVVSTSPDLEGPFQDVSGGTPNLAFWVALACEPNQNGQGRTASAPHGKSSRSDTFCVAGLESDTCNQSNINSVWELLNHKHLFFFYFLFGRVMKITHLIYIQWS